MKWWQRLILNTVVFLALAGFINGFHISTWGAALVAAGVFGILNALLKPILVILSLPITIITLGLFYFIINGLMLWMTSSLVSGFYIQSFGLTVFIAIIVSLLNSFFEGNSSR